MITTRLVRTLRELIEKHYDITGHKTDNIQDAMKSIIESCNSNSHWTLNNKSPKQTFAGSNDQMARHINDSVQNQQVYKTLPFGDARHRWRLDDGAHEELGTPDRIE